MDIVMCKCTQRVEGYFVYFNVKSTQTVEGIYVNFNLQQYKECGVFIFILKCAKVHRQLGVFNYIVCTILHRPWVVLVYIVRCNSTQAVEVSYVLGNVQYYTDIGGFLFSLSCARLHRLWIVLIYILMCNSTQILEFSYVHWNVQQYTDIEGIIYTL
jgi:hypothetical protein